MTGPRVDFHCHLDLYPDPGKAVERCGQIGAYVLSVTTTPKAWRETSALAKGHPRIRTALGLHPQIAHQRLGELPLFEALLPETKYVGEIGLDGSPESRPHWREQAKAFESILRFAAKAGGRILSIHSRRAATAVLDALAREPDSGIPVLHWFSGSKAELIRAVEMGCWFSVGPAMLASNKGRELVRSMPRNRVVTETDGPFAQLGGQTLDPAQVDTAIQRLGEVWETSPEIVEAQVTSSFRQLAGTNGSRQATALAADTGG